MIAKNINTEHKEKLVYYSAKIACGWGNLSFLEQKIIDFLVYKAQCQGKQAQYVVQLSDLINFSGSRSGVNYKRIEKNISNLHKAKINVLGKAKGNPVFMDDFGTFFNYSINSIAIFNSLELNANNFLFYSFNKSFEKYIFNLNSKDSFVININDSKRLGSKTGIILLKMWSAKKKDNAQVVVSATTKMWQTFLGVANSVKATSQALDRGIQGLNKIFGDRYFFIRKGYHERKKLGFHILIFGDNITPYPIANKEDDLGEGTDIEFLHDNCFHKNVERLANTFGIKYLNDKIMTKSVSDNELKNIFSE